MFFKKNKKVKESIQKSEVPLPDPNTIVYFRMKEIEERILDVISLQNSTIKLIQTIFAQHEQLINKINRFEEIWLQKIKMSKIKKGPK